MEKSEKTKRIAENTLFLYLRMLFSMLVSLYTSRVVLNTLGIEDYGIYNVVGGFVAMFSLISSSLSVSTSRYLTFELGKRDERRLCEVFSTSMFIHGVLAVTVLLLSETAGLWFLNTCMVIPTGRLEAANWVFQASVISFILGLFCVPYNASIISHERMAAFAYLGILDVILRLLIVLFLSCSSCRFDRLVMYSLLSLAVTVLFQCVNVLYCRKRFVECRFRMTFDKCYWKDMGAFAGWNFIGCTAGLLKNSGVDILLNLFIGPVLNATRGIAGSVGNAVSSFSSNFMTALNPQITKSYASGDYGYMMSLVERGSRFSFYILLVLALPILFETEFVLTLWLKDYPGHTVNFVRLILVAAMFDILSNTLITLQLATGKVRNYQLTVGGTLMMNFPLSYVCLYWGFPPESVLIVAIVVSFCCLLLRLYFLHGMAGLSIKSYLKNVCLNVFLVAIVASVVPFGLYWKMTDDGWLRFGIITVSCLLSSIAAVYLVGCTKREKFFFRQKVYTLKNRWVG